MPFEDEILTIAELSAHLRVHATTVYRLLREGAIPAFRVGSSWRFSRAAIEKWEREQRGTLKGSTSRGRGRRRKP